MTRSDNPFGDDTVIFRYTRAEAIADGVLIDLSEWAKETGFVIPVACTASVWQELIVPPEGTRELGQDERGRAHDVLWMLYSAIRRGGAGDCVLFDVAFVQSAKKPRPRSVTLKSTCGPGDGGEPVVTIMFPRED